MRVLITGSAGFIGSHLTERFLREGHSVVGVDNYLSGQRRNTDLFLGDANFAFLEADVSSGFTYAGAPLDWVLHFASPASPPHYQQHPIATLMVGAQGTQHALELAKAHGAKFMLASTSEVYGDPLVHPQPESYWGNVNSHGPRSCYDEAKRYAEAITGAYRTHHGVDTRIVRIFNCFGPRMRSDDGRVVTNLVNQALAGEPLTVYGDGQQTRSFQYVDDLVEGIFRLMRTTYTEPVNLGSPAEHTILEFAELIRGLTQSSSQLAFKPLPKDDPKQRRPDISTAKRLLGWEPSVPLKDGLRKTIAYFKSAKDSVHTKSDRNTPQKTPQNTPQNTQSDAAVPQPVTGVL